MNFTMKGILVACVLILTTTLGVQAQEITPINELLLDTAFRDKLPLPMAGISVNSEQTVEVMSEVEEHLGFSPDQLEKIDSVFNAFDAALVIFKNQVGDEFLDNASAILLDKTLTEIKQVDDKVNDYRNIIQSEIQTKEIDKENVDKLIIIWEETNKAERSTNLSETVKKNLRETVAELNKMDARVDEYLNNLLELDLRLNDIHTELEGLIKKINTARGEANKNLLIPDSSPIWGIYSVEKDTVEVGEVLKTTYERQKQRAIEYYNLYSPKIYFALFIVVIIQVVFLVLRHIILKEQIEDPEQKENDILRLFQKPFFPGLLVGIYLAYLFLPEKPFLIEEIMFLSALIPFTIVLINIVRGEKKLLIIYLAFILAVDVVSHLVLDIEIFSRTLMLVITILAINLLGMILRNKWERLNDQPILRSVFRILAKAALGILIICLIGNIVGNYTLTTILLNGVMSTVFSGISFFILYLIVTGLFISVFNSKWGQSFRVIKRYQKDILQKIKRISIFILGVSFIFESFRGFYIYDSLYGAIEDFLITPYKLGNFSFTIYDILLFILILLITSWISRFSQFILQEQVLFKSRTQKDLSASISSLVKFGIVTIGFFIAALASGFPLDKITLLISAFGVGIGFGLQNIFNNLVSGIILVFERPLQVGDTIEVGQLIGVVKSIGIRASTIRTFDGSEVIVPNGNLISNELINWTLSDSQRRLIVKVGVEYGTDPNEVIKLLMGVAKKTKDLLEEPAPYVIFREFGDSSLNFELRCYTESKDWLFILSDLHVKVNNALNEADIVIPFPQRDLHLKDLNPNIVKAVKSSSRSK